MTTMGEPSRRCIARVSQPPWYLHHSRCSRPASSENGLCRQHEKVYERRGCIDTTTGYDEPVTYLYAKDQNGVTHDEKSPG